MPPRGSAPLTASPERSCQGGLLSFALRGLAIKRGVTKAPQLRSRRQIPGGCVTTAPPAGGSEQTLEPFNLTTDSKRAQLPAQRLACSQRF